MNKFRRKCIVAFLMLSTITASAQESEKHVTYPQFFIGMQGGVQTMLANFDKWNTISPTASLSFGSFFTPYIGARLHFNGLWNKGGYISDTNDYWYRYKYLTTDIDLLVNMITLLNKKDYYPLNLYLILGVGANYSWDNGKVSASSGSQPAGYDGAHFCHNARIGTQLDYNISKHISINMEVAANMLKDRYNSMQLTAQLGLTYKFGLSHKLKGSHKDSDTSGGSDISDMTTDASIANTNVGITKNNEVLPAIQEPEPTPPAVLTKINNRRDVFFTIRQTEVSSVEMPKVKEMADWLKAHPSAKVVVTGYADKGTGTSENNARFARERAESVTKLLTKKFGIEPSRITTDSKGDTIQPYPNNNDQNRVTIMIAEGEE